MKNLNVEWKEYMIDMLKNRGAYSVSTNHTQHYTRCPYCGDSRNLSHAHLSIRINISDEMPLVYRCLKCGVSGIVNLDVLMELGLHVDSVFRKELTLYNRKGVKRLGLTNMDKERFDVPLYHESELNRSKLFYVNKRLGTEIDYKKAREYRMVLNLFDFIKFNEIEKLPEESLHMVDTLNSYYVGWLGCNNNTIIFRDITGKQKYRYYKLKLNEANVNGDSFYSMPISIPMLYTNDVHVHIAEGTFDILSIKENVVKESENQMFYASCGFGGAVILNYLVHHGINTGIHLHLYSDADKSDWNHRKYLQSRNHITEWFDHIYIHRNQIDGEKDYGVPYDRIDDRHRILK